MKKSMLIAATLLVSGLAWTSAQAADVYWSLGINAPLDGVGSVGTVIGNYPRQSGVVVQSPDYYGYPAYQPVYRAPPVVYYPEPVRIAYPVYSQHRPQWGDREYRRFEDRRDSRRDERRDEWRDHRHHGD